MGEMTLKQKVTRLKLVADGLRRIKEFESAGYLDEYAAHLSKTTTVEQAVGDGVDWGLPTTDRGMLDYLMAAFDMESWQCPSCGHAEDTATMDSAIALREYLNKAQRPAVATPVEVVDERQVFESWMKEHFKYPVLQIDPLHPEHYDKRETAFAWQARQKRAALAHPRPAVPKCDDRPVAYQVRRPSARNSDWEACTEDAYYATRATGRYLGMPHGTTDVETRALYTAIARPCPTVPEAVWKDLRRVVEFNEGICTTNEAASKALGFIGMHGRTLLSDAPESGGG